MRLRRPATDSARDALANAEAALAAEQEALERTQVALEQAVARRDALDARDAYDANEQAIEELRRDLDWHCRELRRRETDVEAATTAVRRAEYREARGELADGYDRARERSAAVAKMSAALTAALDALQVARADVETLEARVRALAPEDVEDPFQGLHRDEPDWPVTPARELLERGPRQPLAAEAQDHELAERQAKARARERIVRAVEDVVVRGDFRRLAALGPAERAQARELAAERIEAEIARRAAARSDAFALTAGGDAVVAALERRLVRVEELAATSEVHAAA